MEPILFVIDHFRNPNAGTEGQLFNLVAKLDRSRFTPRLLVFSDSEYLQKFGFPCPYDVLGSSKLSSFYTWWRLWKYARSFRREGGRVSHVFFNDPSVICPPVFRSNGISTIISRRDMGYWYTPTLRSVLKFTSRFVSRVIVNSNAVKAVTAQHENYPLDRIAVIYNGYEPLATESESPIELREMRERFPDAVFVTLVANIRPIKRIGDAIRAVSGQRCAEANVHLVVLGGGDSTELGQLAEALGSAARVHFVGGQRDVQNWLRNMDIGLLCSESEGFSNAIIEYMQAGLPVVCSEVGGNPEAVSHGETGFLFACGNTAELERILAELASDATQRRSLGERARLVANERFGMNKMVQEHQRIYLSIQSEGKA